MEKVVENIIAILGEKNTSNKVLSDFITKLIGSDITIFDDLEKEIVELEQALITTQKGIV